MAINFIKDTENSSKIEITNGHLQQLKEITDSYKIDGEAKTLGFLITVMHKAQGTPIIVGDKTFQPAKEIQRENG